MSELIDRIKNFEDHCIETNNPEGAEVLHYAANRIEELEKSVDKLTFMVENGLGFEDLQNDITIHNT
jgi:hypothetical protein